MEYVVYYVISLSTKVSDANTINDFGGAREGCVVRHVDGSVHDGLVQVVTGIVNYVVGSCLVAGFVNVQSIIQEITAHCHRT
jgi:hypothetical protein